MEILKLNEFSSVEKTLEDLNIADQEKIAKIPPPDVKKTSNPNYWYKIAGKTVREKTKEQVDQEAAEVNTTSTSPTSDPHNLGAS